MARFTLALLLAVCLLAAGGCGDSHDSVADDAMDQLEKAANIITGIEDEGDFKQALKDLDAMKEDMKKIAQRAKELGEPDKATKESIEKRMKERSEAFEAKMKDVEASKYLKENQQAGQELMKKFFEVMAEAGDLGTKS